MENLTLSATEQTPLVIFKGDRGVLKIEGKSYSDDINLAYADLLKYIEIYTPSAQETTVIDFKWLYYNTATTRMIVKIIRSLMEHSKVKVNWHCKEGFFLMVKKGEEIKDALGIDLNVILYK